MISCLPELRNLMEYMATLTPTVSAQLLIAVQPLMRLRADFLDFVVLVLRKAIFKKDVTSRLIAVGGFLELIRSDWRADPSSAEALTRTLVDHQTVDHNSALLRMQMFGIFRRCLSQQYEVRARVYCSM